MAHIKACDAPILARLGRFERHSSLLEGEVLPHKLLAYIFVPGWTRTNVDFRRGVYSPL